MVISQIKISIVEKLVCRVWQKAYTRLLEAASPSCSGIRSKLWLREHGMSAAAELQRHRGMCFPGRWPRPMLPVARIPHGRASLIITTMNPWPLQKRNRSEIRHMAWLAVLRGLRKQAILGMLLMQPQQSWERWEFESRCFGTRITCICKSQPSHSDC